METDAGVIKNDMLIAKNSISSAVNSLVSTFGNNDIGNMTFANKYVTSTDYVQDNNFVIDLNLIGTEDNPTDII